MNIFKQWMPYINPTTQTKKLLHETEKQKNRLHSLLKQYQETEGWKRYFNETIFTMTSKMGIMFWRKDKDFRYVLSSPLYCRDFFNLGMELECMKYLEGKTDEELIKDIYTDSGITNTFQDICYVSDEHVKKTRNKTHFFEAGILHNSQLLLYVVKVPLFEEGKFDGILGAAWDFSSHSLIMINQLNRWIYDGLAIDIKVKEDSFVYELKPETHQCDIFSCICPNPERKEGKIKSRNPFTRFAENKQEIRENQL